MHNSSAAEPDLLAPIALERARAIAPFVLFGMVLALLVSEPTGVPLAVPVIAWNAAAVPVMAAMTFCLWRRRVGKRWGHVALGVVWALPTAGTVISQYFVPDALLTLVLLTEVVAGAILLRSSWLLVAYLAIDLAWIPIALREHGDTLRMSMMAIGTAQVVGGLFQRLLVASLFRAEQQLADLRAAERERAELTEQLLHAQRLEVAGTLAAGIAHDMNNVLGSIRNLAELQLAEAASPTMAADLANIVSQSERGAELTRGLLAFSRRGQYRRRVLELDAALREIQPLLSHTLPKSLEVVTLLGAENGRIEVDPHHLGQVIMNLAINAADATPGAGTLTITTEPVELPTGSVLRLRVRDTGCGMDEATRTRVFEPFFTTKPLGNGTGLGLSSVWGVVTAHGGTISVASAVGVGTVFTIDFPRTYAVPALPSPAAVVESRPPRATVLVVDDEPLVRAGTRRILERRGLAVLEAENGEVALEMFKNHVATIGLVILDMGMPVMGGAECFEKLRELAEIPVLIATGYAEDASAQALIARGAALIEKPFASSALARDVARLLALTN